MTGGPGVIAEPARVTAGWLTAALGSVVGDASVTGVRRERIGTGLVGQSVRFTLSWDRARTGLPRTVVGKFPSPDARSRERGRTGGEYEREVRFYSELAGRAARAGLHVPACHVAAYDSGSGDFTLLLEDLAPARPGDQLVGCDVGQARAALAEAAALHAAYWDDPALEELPYLSRNDPEILGAFLADVWPVFLGRYRSYLPPGGEETAARFVGGFADWARGRVGPFTLSHGDFRVDNLMFAGENPAVVDWQTIGPAPAASDVAYFLGASLPPALRRAHEDDLLRGYHAELRRAGVTGYPWPRFVEDYRHAAFAGVVMTIAAAMLVGTDARGERMFGVMLHRHLTHVADTGAASLLA